MRVIEPSNYIPKPGDGKYANLIFLGIALSVMGIRAFISYKKLKEDKEIRNRG